MSKTSNLLLVNKTITNILKFLLFLSIGLTILYLVYSRQSANYLEECISQGNLAQDCSLMEKVINDFKSANFLWIFVVLICFTISNISRALRWNMLLRPLHVQPRLANSFLTIMLGYFANLGLPRLGEFVRAGAMSQYEKINVEKVFGTIVVGRVMDVLSILMLTAFALLLEFDRIWGYFSEHFGLGDKLANLVSNPVFLAIIGLGIAALVFGFLIRKRLMQTLIYTKIYRLVSGIGQGIQTVMQLKNPVLFLLHSANIWLMYFLMTYFCFFAFAPTADLEISAALLVFVFGAWGIVIPSPGGMGTYHALAMAALAFYGLNGNDAFSWANISFFSIQIGCNVLMGLLALLLLPIINRGYKTLESDGLKKK